MPVHDSDPSIAGISRRTVLAALLSAPFWPTEAFSQAAAAAEGSIAGKIGGALADKALSAVTDYAFGQVMSFTGIDLSGQSEVSSKLNEIIHSLAVLQATVDQLSLDMHHLLAQQNYDLTAAKVDTLINLNGTLTESFRILTAAGGAEAEAIKADIRGYLTDTLLTSLSTWHNALCGVNNTTGLLAAWNSAVYSKNPLFGPSAAQAIQANWEFLDAQQALTVTFLIEHLHDTHQPLVARSKLIEWQRNRKIQLQHLRGAAKAADVFTTIGPDGKPFVETTPVKALPPKVVISTKTNIMWSLHVFGAIPQQLPDYNGALENNREILRHLTGLDDWWTMDADTVLAFMKECGAQVGGGANDPDHFQFAMENVGFSFPGVPSQVRLWTKTDLENHQHCPNHPGYEQVPHPPPGYCHVEVSSQQLVAFVEGENWWHPSGNPEDTAMVLLGRELGHGQAASADTKACMDTFKRPPWNDGKVDVMRKCIVDAETARYWYSGT